MTAPCSVDDVLGLFDTAAAKAPYDEVVTEREHALQCAGLAIAAGAPDAAVAAALLHDVGHLIGLADGTLPSGGDDRHDERGARWLRPLFGPEVTAPISLHVAAKRYLCGTEPGYLDLLSPASVASLAVQGRPMAADEARAFERRRGWQTAVQLRRWDDQAKVAGAPTAEPSDHRALLVRVASPLAR